MRGSNVLVSRLCCPQAVLVSMRLLSRRGRLGPSLLNIAKDPSVGTAVLQVVFAGNKRSKLVSSQSGDYKLG